LAAGKQRFNQQGLTMTDLTRSQSLPKASRRDWIGLAVIAVPCLLYSMDLTVLHLAVPQISADLTPTASQLLWIVDIYGFLIAGLLLTMGTLGDRIGRRRLLMIGAGAFAITSLMAAFAPTSEALVVARALQGIAAATLAPSTLSLIRNMFLDPKERTFAIGMWVAAFSAGGALGPVVGGLLLEHFWWGSVFLINVPLMVALMALAPTLLPEYKDPAPERIDLVSVTQAIVATLATIYGIKRIAEDGLAPAPVAAIVAGLLVGFLFVRRQRQLVHPLIDVTLFRRRAFGTALGVNLLGLFTVMGTFFFIAQYLQLVAGLGPLHAGLWLAPSGVAFAAGSVLAPRLAGHYPHGTIITWSFLVAAMGFLIMTQMHRGDGLTILFIGMMVFCFGLAPIGTLTTDLVISAAPPERAGAASGISETSFEFGGALGIAVLGSLVAALYRLAMDDIAAIPALSTPAMAAARATLGGAVGAAHDLPAAQASELLATARAAYLHAFTLASWFSTGATLLAAALSYRLLHGARASAGH
jgi:DHA2 family multidrug resistance protein-like MFS transporter